jgi:hypothetical protein
MKDDTPRITPELYEELTDRTWESLLARLQVESPEHTEFYINSLSCPCCGRDMRIQAIK